MSTKNTNILTGTTSTGIKFQIDTRVKDDARLLLYLTRMQSKTLDDLAKGQAMMSILELLFGSGEGLEMFFNEVAAKHESAMSIANTSAYFIIRFASGFFLFIFSLPSYPILDIFKRIKRKNIFNTAKKIKKTVNILIILCYNN
jgi:hypothetical protein